MCQQLYFYAGQTKQDYFDWNINIFHFKAHNTMWVHIKYATLSWLSANCAMVFLGSLTWTHCMTHNTIYTPALSSLVETDNELCVNMNASSSLSNWCSRASLGFWAHFRRSVLHEVTDYFWQCKLSYTTSHKVNIWELLFRNPIIHSFCRDTLYPQCPCCVYLSLSRVYFTLVVAKINCVHALLGTSSSADFSLFT